MHPITTSHATPPMASIIVREWIYPPKPPLHIDSKLSLNIFMETLEKRSISMHWYNISSGILKAFRFLELCLTLFFLSWFLTCLLFGLWLFIDYLCNPIVVFTVSRVIIATLLSQSCWFTQSNFVVSSIPEYYQINDTCTKNDSSRCCNSWFMILSMFVGEKWQG